MAVQRPEPVGDILAVRPLRGHLVLVADRQHRHVPALSAAQEQAGFFPAVGPDMREGRVDFGRAGHLRHSIVAGDRSGQRLVLPAEILEGALQDLRRHPGDRFAGLHVGYPDQAVMVAEFQVDLKRGDLGKKPRFLRHLAGDLRTRGKMALDQARIPADHLPDPERHRD